MSYDPAPYQSPENAYLIEPRTGEALPATVENAHGVLVAARDLKQRLQQVIETATGYLVEESRRQGTKTFHVESGEITLTGGTSVEYDPETLEALLREAGCPEERIRAVVKEEVVTTYKVDRGVLRQLVGANPDYAAAAEGARREIEKRWRASAT